MITDINYLSNLFLTFGKNSDKLILWLPLIENNCFLHTPLAFLWQISLKNIKYQYIKLLIGVNKNHLKFSIQIFNDIDPEEAKEFWINQLKIKEDQFYKTIITKSGSIGTYKNKSKYGVMTVYYLNKRLKDLLIELLLKR